MQRTYPLLLIALLAVSSLSLMIAKPASALSVPSPTIPQFTVKYIKASYPSINPYTGASEQVDNSTIQLSIQNQPFNALSTYSLYYNVRTKGHFESDNWTIQEQDVSVFSNSAAGISDTLGVEPSDSEYTVISYPADYPPDSQVDFQVQAIVYNLTSVFQSDHPLAPPPLNQYGTYYQIPEIFKTTNWSNTQTVTIGQVSNSSSPAPTSTLTVPEFPALVIFPLILSIFSVAVILRHRKTAYLKQ